MCKLLIRRTRQNGVEETNRLVLRPCLQSRVDERGILVALELVDGVVHERGVEDVQRAEEAEVRDFQPRHLPKEPRLKLRDDVLKAVLAVVREVHEHGDARRELDELLLNLLAL